MNRHYFKLYLLGLVSILAIQSSEASLKGTPDQDPYIAWARTLYAQGKVPSKDDLYEGKTWKCTMAFSIRDMNVKEKVPTFKFKIEGKNVYNELIYQEQDQSSSRRYAFKFSQEKGKYSNLLRTIKLGWRVSIGSAWANPELYTEFSMSDSIRVDQNGRLIVQRAITESDKDKLSKTYAAYLHALGKPERSYQMAEALPNFGEISNAGQKFRYAFQYFVCNRPDTEHIEKDEEGALLNSSKTFYQAKIEGNKCRDSFGKDKFCFDGKVPTLDTLIEWYTESSQTATSWLSSAWFSHFENLEEGQENQTVEFSEENAHALNEIYSSRDSEGHALNITPGRAYKLKT
jgi:hypothetical protein